MPDYVLRVILETITYFSHSLGPQTFVWVNLVELTIE